MRVHLAVSVISVMMALSLHGKSQTMEIPAEHDSASFMFQLNAPEKLSFRFVPFRGEKRDWVTFLPAGEKWNVRKLAPEWKKIRLENHLFKVTVKPGVSFDYYVRPKTFHYNAADIKSLLPQWQAMPDALRRKVALEVRFDGGNSRIYLDGRYAFSYPGRVRRIDVRGGEDYVIGSWRTYANPQGDYENFEVLDVGVAGTADAMRKCEISLTPGRQRICDIPFAVVSPERSSDLAVTRNTNGQSSLDVDAFLARDAFDALRESQVISVPAGYYHKIHLLFAIDSAPGKERKFTVKIGQSSPSGRTTSAGYTDIVLPVNEKDFPATVRKVGTVKDSHRERNLYLGTFPLALGDYMGLLEPGFRRAGRAKMSNYIDVEIFGPRYIGTKPYFSPHLKPTGKPSAITLFGATLEKAPASIHLTPSRPAYAFSAGEKAETSLKITARKAGNYRVEMKILDLRDCVMKPAVYDWEESLEKPLRTISGEAALERHGEKTLAFDLSMPKKGHYATRINFYRNGERVLTHVGGFVLFPENDRRAAREDSPYSIWWWGNGVHDTWTDLEEAYRLMHDKLGIHQYSYAPFSNLFFSRRLKEKHPALAAEKILPPQMRFYNIPEKIRHDEKQMLAFIEKRYKPMWDRYPEVKSAVIFHESYGDVTPPEIFGIRKQLTPQERKRDLSFVRAAEALGSWYRKHHPEVELVFGNQTSSTAIIAALLRSGFDPKYIDRIGLETPGQGSMPERLWQGGVQASLYMKELLKYYKLDIPLTACYEYTARPARIVGYDYKYQIRDALLAYANHYDLIPLGALQTAGNSYTQTIWGDGLLLPEPYRYPTPALSAVHTITNLLDQASFKRHIPTGSNSIYLQEYARKRGDFVYVSWAPAGRNRMRFVFPEGTKVSCTDMYGDGKPEKNTFSRSVTAFPFYITASRQLRECTVLERKYPPKPGDMSVVHPFDRAGDFVKITRPLCPEVDVAYICGDFSIRNADDAEKGKCIEVRLNQTGRISPLNTEFVKLKLTRQIVVKDNMDWIGLWVKGDSGWGKVSFDVVDAKDTLYLSDGIWHDFDCQMTINHDGWRFMRIPFGRTDRELTNPSLGVRWQVGSGWASSPEPQYPITVTAVNVALRRVAPAPVDWVRVPGCIRMKNIAVSGASDIALREIRPLDAETQKHLESSGVRYLITAGDIPPQAFRSSENGEIHYTGAQRPVFTLGRLPVKRDAFAFEVRFKLPSQKGNRAHAGLSFKINGRFYFPLSPAGGDSRFTVPADQYATARIEVKNKEMKFYLNEKLLAEEILTKTPGNFQLIKNRDPLIVHYMAVCDLGAKKTSAASVSFTGATNAQDQAEALGN